jgi:uncharacterized protein YjbI with pentapeptide repeats
MSNEPRKKALIIAVSDYNDNKLLPPLEFCKNDGEKMYELLSSIGYEISDDHKLIGNVTANAMRNAIHHFFDNRKTKADDTLLFYYSGHGIPVSDGNILASSETEYYSPRRMGFSSSELTNIIQDSNSIRIVEVLDCCYAGAARIGEGPIFKGSEEDQARIGTANIEKNAKLLPQGEGKCLLAASQAAQEAFGLREKGHSIFTYYLLEGLKGNKKSVDSEGNVTPDSLGNYVYKEIMNLPEGKKPKQKPIKKTEASGEIILATYAHLKQGDIDVILGSLSKLLQEGSIEEFNKKRNQLPTNLLNFSKMNLSKTNLSRGNLCNVNLSRADLSNADLEEADLSKASLHDTELEWASLQYANLSNADLNGANFSNADLSKANLSNANLSNANLSNANLSKANLSNTDLSNANLSKANLYQTRLKNSKVINAKFSGFPSIGILEGNDLHGAVFEKEGRTAQPSEEPNTAPTREPNTAPTGEPNTAPTREPLPQKKEIIWNGRLVDINNIKWDDLLDKDVRTLSNEEIGKVRGTPGEYLMVIHKYNVRFRHRYMIPRSKVNSYGGGKVFVDIFAKDLNYYDQTIEPRRFIDKNVDLYTLATSVQEFINANDFSTDFFDHSTDVESKYTIQFDRSGIKMIIMGRKRSADLYIKGSPNDFTVTISKDESFFGASSRMKDRFFGPFEKSLWTDINEKIDNMRNTAKK